MATTLERGIGSARAEALPTPPFEQSGLLGQTLPRWQRPSSFPPPRFWSRAALVAVAALAVFFYTWGLARNGYANEYYAAAVLSMAQSWKAFFFGSIDALGFITVDKPPFAFWVQALSARVFGFSSWSILLPQAAAGVATVLALYHLTRRTFGALAATLAALVLVLTPITVAIARDNLPDAALVLLLVGGAWGTLNGLRSGRLRPLLVGAALVGLGFNTKMLQAYLVVPSFVLTYLALAPGSLRRRIGYLAAAGVVLAVVSASWMLVVDAIPASQRPYIGGSTDNSVLELVLGYNGLARILGRGWMPGSPGGPLPGGEPGPGGPGFGGPGPGGSGFGGPGFGGQAGWLRLFNAQVGGQISWLLPLAAASLLAGLIARRRQPRTDGVRAWYLLWGGWLATHFLVFSFAEGIFHPYYTVDMAPAIAALCGPGIAALWDLYRRGWRTAWLLPASLGATAAWAIALLSRSAWLPWLRPVVLAAAALAIVGLLAGRLVASGTGRLAARTALALGLVAVLAGPTAWASTPLQNGALGVIPAAGPMDAGASGFGGGRPDLAGGPPPGFAGGAAPPGARGFPRAGQVPRNADANGSGLPGGMPPGMPFQAPSGADAFAPGGGMGPPGAPGERQPASPALIAYLEQHRGSAAYLVAVDGANSAAPLILATGQPVMAMGGFSGSDPAPTTAQLQALVASGDLRFVLGGGRGGFGRGGSERTRWVQANCAPVDPSVYGGQGGQQLYDCTTRATF